MDPSALGEAVLRVLLVSDAGASTQDLLSILQRLPGVRVVHVERSNDTVTGRGDGDGPAPDVAVVYAPTLDPDCLRACHALRQRARDLPVLVVVPAASGRIPRSSSEALGRALTAVLSPAAHSQRAERDEPLGDATDAEALLARLTPMELRMLELIADGLTNREIGDELRLAHQTVKNHVSAIFVKLGVSRRAEAAAWLARAQALAARRVAATPRRSSSRDVAAQHDTGSLGDLVDELRADVERLRGVVTRLPRVSAKSS